jgi:NIPSNAP
MTVASVATWRPRDGKLAEFMANVSQAKKIHERLGGSVRIWQTMFGAEMMTLGYVIEFKDMAAFAAFNAKLDGDSEWQEFWIGALAQPSADFLANSLVVEVDNL